MRNVKPKPKTYDDLWNPYTKRLALIVGPILAVALAVSLVLTNVGEGASAPAVQPRTSSPSPAPSIAGAVPVTQGMVDEVTDTIARLYVGGEYERIGVMLADLSSTTGCGWHAFPGYAVAGDFARPAVREKATADALSNGVDYIAFGMHRHTWVAVLVECA